MNKKENFNNFVSSYKWKNSSIYMIYHVLKEIFWNPLMFIFTLGMFFVFISSLLHTKPTRYVGTIREVSIWDGNAILDTKTINGKDTLLHVHKNKFESFEEGQTITVWTGGDLFDGIATTSPQH
jgi:hypothetical protein